MGAPALSWGDGEAPFYLGYYAGGNLVAIPTAPGASGSAIMSAYGVVGVLVAVNTRFNSATYMVPLADLQEFLR